MLHVIRPAILSTDLERRIAAFERAFARNDRVDPADFLPPPDHPHYRDGLAEILRVDIELRWSRRRPQTIESYLARFPILRSDPHLLGQLAFEEYRQRLQAGENVSPQEYCRHFGLSWEHWPAPMEQPKDDATCAVSCRPVGGSFSRRPPARAEERLSEQTELPRVGDLVLRRFRIKEPLGRGAFGSVFLAERLDLFDRPVALKFIDGHSVEPAMLAQLIHENIVPIESAERFGSMVVICMPFRGRTTLQHIIDGLPRDQIGSLSTAKFLVRTAKERSSSAGDSIKKDVSLVLESGGVSSTSHHSQVRKLSELDKLARLSHVEASLHIIAAVANGLAHAHEHKIVHRDLKPANILLSDDGTPMILDFNLAATLRRTAVTDSVRLGGTFPYMAPEQIEATRSKEECLDPRSDLYSLGVVMFELLTGRLPFPKVNRVVDNFVEQMLSDRREICPDVRRYNPSIPESVAAIVTKLLAYHPADRYQLARHVKEDIERELNNLPLKYARETSWRGRWIKYRRRHPTLTTALAASLFVVAPALAAASWQYLSYQRLAERQRAEAIVKRQEALRDAFAAQALAHSAGRDSRLLRLSLDRAEHLAQLYALNDSDWEKQPDVQKLTEDERQELWHQLGDTFFVVANAVSEVDRRNAPHAGSGRAETLQHWAELCYRRSGKSLQRAMASGSVEPQQIQNLPDEELYHFGMQKMAERQYGEAAQIFRELTTRDGKNFPAWFRLADCLNNLGQDAAATHAWTVCVALQPDSAVCHFNLALAYSMSSDFAKAERYFSKAYQLDPDMVSALANRASCRSRLGQWDDALADWNEVIARMPQSAHFRLRRAQCLARQGRIFAAMIDEAVGMNIDPDDEFGFSLRGYLRLFGGDGRNLRPGLTPEEIEAALQDLDRAIKLNPRNRTTLQNRVAALERLGRWEEAVQAAHAMLEQFPDMPLLPAQLAGFLARLGRVEEATQAIKRALKLAPRDAAIHYQVGAVYSLLVKHDKKFKDDAMHHLEAALARGYACPGSYHSDPSLAGLQGEPRFERILATAATLRAMRYSLGRP